MQRTIVDSIHFPVIAYVDDVYFVAIYRKWGFSWQITPRALLVATTDPDRAAAKRAMNAMMTMRKIDIAAIEAARAKQ